MRRHEVFPVEAACVLLPLVSTAILGWQLVTGKILGRYWNVSMTRNSTPRLYWGLIAFHVVVTLLMWGVCAVVMLGKAH